MLPVAVAELRVPLLFPGRRATRGMDKPGLASISTMVFVRRKIILLTASFGSMYVAVDHVDTDCLRGHTHVSFINDNFNDNSHNNFSDKDDCTIVSCNDNDNKNKHCNDSGHTLENVHTHDVCDDLDSEKCNIIHKLCVDYCGHDVKDIKNDPVSFVFDQGVNTNDTCNINVIGDVSDGHANLCE
jgi:hypothetical protein